MALWHARAIAPRMADFAAPTPLTEPVAPGHRAELGALLRLATPLVGANLLQMGVYAIDVVFVARLTTVELAASTLGVFLYGLMLWADWLLLSGSWKQTLLGLGDTAAATGLPFAWFYGAGVVFGISAGVILIHDLFRVLSGAASEADLVAVREEEQ